MNAPPRVDPLLRAVLEQPEALEPRLVWADALVAAGDPRGEFVLLQCMKPITEVQRRRASALRRRWGMYWCCGLERLIPDGEVQFEHGVLVACALRRAPVWQQELIHPDPTVALLRRVRIARKHEPEEERLERVLVQLPGVVVAQDVSYEEVRALGTGGSALREVRLEANVDLRALDALSVPSLQTLLLPSGATIPEVERLLDRHVHLSSVDIGVGVLLAWHTALRFRGLEALTVRIVGWSLRLSGQDLKHLDVWHLPSFRERALRGLVRELATLPIGALDFIHVRGGRPPERTELLELQRAAQGTPLLLPATWRRVLMAN